MNLKRELYFQLKEQLLSVFQNEIVLMKMAREIEDDLGRLGLEGHLPSFSAVYQEEDSIFCIQIGPRDYEFNSDGRLIGAGLLVDPARLSPWMEEK